MGKNQTIKIGKIDQLNSNLCMLVYDRRVIKLFPKQAQTFPSTVKKIGNNKKNKNGTNEIGNKWTNKFLICAVS